jgi:hypothetical protein
MSSKELKSRACLPWSTQRAREAEDEVSQERHVRKDM